MTILRTPFKLTCELDQAKKIQTLAINDAIIFQRGKLVLKDLTEIDISSQKKDLESLFSKDFSNYKKFVIQNFDGKLFVKSNDLFSKIFLPFTKSLLSLETERKITKIAEQIEERKNVNNIFSYTKVNNINEIENKPKTNRKLTALFLGLIALGFLSLVIGIGALLPQIGVISPSLGITGIPLNAAIALSSIGGLTIISIAALKIASKKSKIANEYLKDILRLKGQMFLEGNSNDFTNACLYILVGLAITDIPGLETLKGCLAYPTGILLMMSAIYQGIQSIKNLKNSKQTKDKELFLKSVFSTLFALSLFSVGVITTLGLVNSPIAPYFVFTTGSLMLILAGFGMKKSYSKLKELLAVNDKDPNSILEFLQNNLSLKTDEISKIKEKISKYTNKDITDWINKNIKNFEAEEKKIWQEILQNLKIQASVEILEVKKLIVNEEIKNAIEKKLDSLRSLLKEETYKEALLAYYNYKADPKAHAKELTQLFAKIKKEIKIKTAIETIKFFLLFLPYMLVPALNMNGLINIKVYDGIMASLNFLSLSINSTPRFRNIPPAVDKNYISINSKLNNYKNLKLFANKTQKVAKKTLQDTQLKAVV